MRITGRRRTVRQAAVGVVLVLGGAALWAQQPASQQLPIPMSA
jgi:hypothetical protein